MHRSGTSLVARLFFEAGADMGEAETFYRADKWNSNGYYEQVDIHAINMPLINGYMWKFAYFFLPSTQTILRRARKYEHQIIQAGKNYQGKIVKENRFCLTLPAWQQYDINIEKILICIRSPDQIVASLIKRNHITKSHAYNLWIAHIQRLLQYTKKTPIWIIDYNNLLLPDRFESEITAAFGFLGIDIPKDRIVDLSEKIICKDLNHYTGQKEVFPKEVQLLWETLRLLHNNQFTDKPA